MQIPEESISSVLEFYHDLGVFYHYSHIENLSQKVIADPHWLIKVIGSLFPFEEQPDVGNQLMWRQLRRKGILSESLLNAILKNQEHLSPSEITSLLKYFLIIAEINTRCKHHFPGKEYFVPAVLKPDEKELTTDKNCFFPAEPLFLTFSTGYVPPGFFTRFAAVLSQNPLLQIVISKTMSCNRIQLFYGTKDHKDDKISITENINNVKIDIFVVFYPLQNLPRKNLFLILSNAAKN